jgi:hypothetical protein
MDSDWHTIQRKLGGVTDRRPQHLALIIRALRAALYAVWHMHVAGNSRGSECCYKCAWALL